MVNNKIEKKKAKSIVFGATESAKDIYDWIRKDFQIIAFCDNNRDKWGKYLQGEKIISPEELSDFDFEFIIIVSTSSLYIIKDQLMQSGIKEEKIITKYIEHRVLARNIFLKNFANLKTQFEESDSEIAVAEVGVFQGEYACMINKYFPDKKLYLFDTFEGFDDRDIKYEVENDYSNASSGELNMTCEELVIRKMQNPQNVVIRKGYFPETAKDINKQFIFVSLDVDLYMPTLEGLRFFYPKLVGGGCNSNS